MSFTLYFTGVLTGFAFAAYGYSSFMSNGLFWRTYWAGGAGGMSAISVLTFAGMERGVVTTYYFVCVWLTMLPIHFILSKAPTTLKIPGYLKIWFYGVPPFLGIRLAIHVWAKDERGSLGWFSILSTLTLLITYLILFRKLNKMIARERALVLLFPDYKDPL